MRKPLVMGNWKMNGDQSFVSELLLRLKEGFDAPAQVSCAVFPPYPYLAQSAHLLGGCSIELGAQNLCLYDKGAYTGEVSAAMLVDVGCQYVLLGHSERRHVFGESDQVIAGKLRQALLIGLTPVLCIGETLAEREQGQTHAVLERQLSSVLDEMSADEMKKLVIAYEPVWAIGTGQVATPDQAAKAHEFVRGQVASCHEEVAKNIQIVYGGSVNASNAAELFALEDVDGGLVGGASLKADVFLDVVRVAAG